MESFIIQNGSSEGLLIHYYPSEARRSHGAVLIFSGGGYSHRSYHEGEPYALMLNEIGIDAFLVDYRVNPHLFPAPLIDARRAVAYVRENCEKYGIDPEKIAVMGSSAGGHLAALVSTYKERVEGDETEIAACIPNAQILCYPVTDITSHRGSYEMLLGDRVELCDTVNPITLADESTPRAFIWHTSTDDCVDVKGSYRYAARLSECGVSCEMHIYPIGVHGLGLATGDPKRERVEYVQRWPEELTRWFKLIGWIEE
ncbi:MAG: alpha/beta hydrolase [Clostridia bacterium]|nr:alpha/beta hydrolase [Clostridia bacterium]